MIALHETAVRLLLKGDPAELDTLVDAFKIRPNGYVFAPSYERYKLTGGKEGWDGYNRHLKRIGRTQASILRGRRDEVIAVAGIHKIELDFSQLLPRPFESLSLADISPNMLSSDFALDEYQCLGIYRWLRSGIGINQASVGAGKTAMFAGAAKMIKGRFPEARFLYLTPAERLVRQVTPWMRQFLPDWDIGQFGGGKREQDAADMVVCTVAMLRRHFDRLSSEHWWRTFMAVLYDEAHHAPSDSSQEILLQIPAYFRLGASDSIKINDEDKQATMKGLLGDILGSVTAEPLIASGRLAVPHIYVESMADLYGKFDELGFQARPDTPAWCLVEAEWVSGQYLGPVYALNKDGTTKMKTRTVMEVGELGRPVKYVVEEPVIEPGYHCIQLNGETQQVESRWCLLQRVYDQAIVNCTARNERIALWARYYSARSLPTLVVCTRTLHIYILEKMIQEVVAPELVRILFGWSTPTERDRSFEWLKSTPGAVLITPLVKEGVSINEIRAGIVADYVGDIETANQIVGRFMRKKEEDNFAEITWFAEDHQRSLRQGSRRILRQFKDVYKYRVHDPAPDVQELLKQT